MPIQRGLITGLLAAIMGPGANKEFDPTNPESRPFQPAQSGFGRFLRRAGGYEPELANQQYAVERGLITNEMTGRQGLEKTRFGNESALTAQRIAGQQGLQQAEIQGRQGLEELSNQNAFRRLAASLENQAALQSQQQNFQLRRDQSQDATEDQRYRSRTADQRATTYGTYDPILQQDRMSQQYNTAQSLSNAQLAEATGPRAIGSRAIYMPGQGVLEYTDPTTSYPTDAQGNMSIQTTPGGFRPLSISQGGASGSPAQVPTAEQAPNQLSPEELQLLQQAAQGGGAQQSTIPTWLQRFLQMFKQAGQPGYQQLQNARQ